jgi:lipopolysaccharide export LptBFGC system permease protein LptF
LTSSHLNNRVAVARGLVLAAALLSFVFSVVLFFTESKTESIFVGLWVPSILALGAFVAPRSEPFRQEGAR